MRVGIVNRFTAATRSRYPLGLALERVGATFVPIEIHEVTGVLGSSGPPRVVVGDVDLDTLDLDGLVWRVSENDFHRFADLQRLLAGRLPMVNTLGCHERCADKWTTSVALAGAGIEIVPTTLLSPGTAVPAFPRTETVIKPTIGARGRGVRIADAGSVPPAEESYLAQPRVGGTPEDQIRALVCGPETVLALHRVPAGHGPALRVNNFEAGGKPRAARAEPIRDIALTTAHVLGAALLGVDLVRWEGKWAVLEANSSPGLTGISRVTDVDCYRLAAEAIVAAIRSAVPGEPRLP
jgi:glutathione synthase/RimK-type ligase-like ATP-grasp enzyme